MECVFELVRGKKMERVRPIAPQKGLPVDEQVWRILPGGSSSFHEGDVVCSRRPISIQRASRRVASWRTRVTPQDLVLLHPAEGWSLLQGDRVAAGAGVVAPYSELFRERFDDRPDPAA